MNETKKETAAQDQKGGFMSRFGRRGEREAADATIGERAAAEPAELPVRPAAAVREPSAPVGRDMNILTEGLVIEGNVFSETAIVIRGTVRGDVTCRGDVEISGEIVGDVKGKNVRISGGGVQGDVTASEMLHIDHSQIKGALSATHARINNPIEGDITVRGTLTLQREANIQGNIMAAGLSVEEGASMNGQITISRERPATPPVRPAVVAVPTPTVETEISFEEVDVAASDETSGAEE